MQRYLITNNDKFTGQAELVYNDKGTLCIIDCTDADMDEDTMHRFKNAAPVTAARLQQAFTAPTVIVEAGFDITFERFYKDYPTKRNRHVAEKHWQKLTETDKIKAWHSLSGYKKYCSRNDWYKPMLSGAYLTRREFETDWNKEK